MYTEDYLAVGKAAQSKSAFARTNPAGYFVSSMLAGVFVGFGVLLAFTIGGLLTGQPHAKIVMGASFGIALSLVIMAGSELFTGNNFVMTAGALGRAVAPAEVLRVWILCYIGNWAGSILLALLFQASGLTKGPVGEFIATAAAAKMSLPLLPMLVRAFLCNALVCLAVWCSFRCKSESGKLIMVFWCLYAFITTGFEHSIANMTLLSIALLAPQEAAVSLGGYFYNILFVTFGNMLGGIVCVALPYHLISRRKEG